jgi:nitroreductase
MDIFELIKTRRSIRSFDSSKPVNDETIKKILEAGIWAPSAGNTQCWRFFVIRNEKIKGRLAVEAGHQPFIAEAPVVIVVTADLDYIEKSYGGRGRYTYALQDTAAAIQNILLAVTALGLGCCWVGAFLEEKAAKILELPQNLRPLAMLPIGHPAEKPAAPPRRKVEEVTVYR